MHHFWEFWPIKTQMDHPIIIVSMRLERINQNEKN